jgi:hypothetical protein
MVEAILSSSQVNVQSQGFSAEPFTSFIATAYDTQSDVRFVADDMMSVYQAGFPAPCLPPN